MSPSAHDPPASEPMTAQPPPAPAQHTAERLTIGQARDLLDWLEGHGIQAHEVTLESDGTMTVRWPT